MANLLEMSETAALVDKRRKPLAVLRVTSDYLFSRRKGLAVQVMFNDLRHRTVYRQRRTGKWRVHKLRNDLRRRIVLDDETVKGLDELATAIRLHHAQTDDRMLIGRLLASLF